jgi:hypothetical protein
MPEQRRTPVSPDYPGFSSPEMADSPDYPAWWEAQS